MKSSSRLSLLILCLAQWASAATVYFPITLTWANRTVAGVTRPIILTNGQFPAPPLQMKQNDEVIFDVTNLCPFSVTVHFHGIEQIGTPWSDGVPGMSQRPIPTFSAFRYRWTALQYGAYFYHAHHRGQIEDGLFGPITISPASSEEKPFNQITNNTAQLQALRAAEANTKPMLLADWRLLTSEEIWDAEVATGLDAFCVNALLINGKGSVSCLPQALLNSLVSPQIQAVLGNETLTDIGCFPPTVTAAQGDFPHDYDAIPPTMFSGCTPTQGNREIITVNAATQQYVSWDLTSAAGHLELVFSVDEHDMWVYAIDGRYINPIRVNAVTIPSSNRYSVMIPLTKPRGDYNIRLVSGAMQQIINTTATLRYTGTPQLDHPSNPWIMLNGSAANPNTVFLDEKAVIPFPPLTPAETPDATYFLTIGRFNSSYLWTLGNSSFGLELEESQPLLFNQTAIPDNLIIRTQNNTWIDLIMQVNSGGQPAHPIHKHSNKHFLLGSGDGIFNYSSVAEAMQFIPESFNLVNPQYRDTSSTPDAGVGPTWMAIRYHVVNPGAFLMHCHIQVHQSGGMALAFLDGVDKWPTIPPAYRYDSGFFPRI
ncbi:hypothetical protein N7492_007340 [Penicillium capsulatum]|uniref:Multicopper oxidase n=1 Tax=Penicillium capsulatum TaxID=69766 RepID=A0A9W9HZN3_9EURO|nr:hypothetical protein N7492_007340 [Penicillium capsulatum]KAJ6117180.1 hypothetical protein N7512_006905 [Penicillium capsulatum]